MRNDFNNTRPSILENGSPLFCDLYHLTMAQAWFLDGKAGEIKTSESFFRRCPFGGSYLLAAGLAEFSQWLNNWHFSDEDIAYLRDLKNADGSNRFSEDFLNYVKNDKLRVSIKAVNEGEVIFPNEPIYSVTGPCWQVEIIEAALLNIFNSQSLIATKASRIARASTLDGVQRPLLEFGLRRGQELGCFSATRASYIGGATGTSNVAAGKHYGIPVSGTMAHSFIMSYENELDAFKAYMRTSKGNTTLLVDTYDTREGIKNAIRAAKETGIKLMGMRIDSGDLAYWAKEARKIIDEELENMEDKSLISDVNLVASNDLDEYAIENLVMVQNAPYDIFAAGTKLVTAYDCPALGGVFKTKRYNGEPKIKIAEGKTTIPGDTDVVRIIRNGKYDGDVICRANDNIVENGKLVSNITSYTLGSQNMAKVTFNEGEEAYTLLQPLMENGKFVRIPEFNVNVLQKRAKDNLSMLDESHKRLSNPHIYGVGLETRLFNLQQDLIRAHSGRE